MPNTFPEWWGHQESEPQHNDATLPRKEVEKKDTIARATTPESLPESYGTSWISCKS